MGFFDFTIPTKGINIRGGTNNNSGSTRGLLSLYDYTKNEPGL